MESSHQIQYVQYGSCVPWPVLQVSKHQDIDKTINNNYKTMPVLRKKLFQNFTFLAFGLWCSREFFSFIFLSIIISPLKFFYK